MLFKIKRKSTTEIIYHKKIGNLMTRIIKIKKTFLGIPYKTIHKYRETYFGEVKDVSDCKLSR